MDLGIRKNQPHGGICHSLKCPTSIAGVKTVAGLAQVCFLGTGETFRVVISSSLTKEQETTLLEVLHMYRQAIGWTIADIKGIDSSVCTHRIFLEDNVKPSRQPQRRLNPNMKEVVRAEVMKLWDVDIIYPIADSPWVSPVQVVPKKSGITVVENEKN